MMSKFVSLFGHGKTARGCPGRAGSPGWLLAGEILGLLVEEPLGDLRGRDRQPPVYQRFPEVVRGDRVQLDQVGVVAVEVRDGEEAVLPLGEDGLLLRPVGGADREDRAGRRRLVAEALDVRLAER
jgi:hypothetical protein